MTPQGKVYSTDELINLARIGSMGQLSEVCLQAFLYIKRLEEQVRSQIPPTGITFTVPNIDVSSEVEDK